MAKKDNTRPKNLDAKIAEKLDEAFDIAEEYFMTKDEAIPNFATDNLNREFIDALELMAIPSIKYYLRMLTNPGAVLPAYVKKLAEDEAVGFEHRDVWNKIATGDISMNNK